jgi:tetratricopeptide (TPR) repeat protein
MSRAQLTNAQNLYAARKYAEAEKACREALKARPGDMAATRLLGQITRHTGKASESVQIFQQLRQARPNDVPLLGELGASLVMANMHPQAFGMLSQAVKAMPAAAPWRMWMGRALTGLFQLEAAVRTLEQAHEMAPDDPDISFHLANALLNAAREKQAEPHARRYLEKFPDSVAGRTMLAKILEHQARLDESIALLREILGDEPGASHDANLDQAVGGLIRCLNARGDRAGAMAICERAAVGSPRPNLLAAMAPVYLQQQRYGEIHDLLGAVLDGQRMPEPVRAGLLFFQAEALRGLREHDKSFATYIRANGCYPDSYDRGHKAKVYDALIETFSAERIGGPRATLDGSRFVFIVGMPRSGTSLVEQIIDAHPRAFGAGELGTLPTIVDALARRIGTPPPMCFARARSDMLDEGARMYADQVGGLAPGAAVITDKLPHNFELVGLINIMLPGARVIHCTRDPIDNCVSAFCTQLSAWHSYSNRLDTLGWAYAEYVRLMAHYRRVCDLPLLEVGYEAVVGDLEAQARRIIGFVGLEWDDRCLRFYETDRAVTTASVDQVRQPIYTSSVARWKRYERHLGPLIESLRAGGVTLEGV